MILGITIDVASCIPQPLEKVQNQAKSVGILHLFFAIYPGGIWSLELKYAMSTVIFISWHLLGVTVYIFKGLTQFD